MCYIVGSLSIFSACVMFSFMLFNACIMGLLLGRYSVFNENGGFS